MLIEIAVKSKKMTDNHLYLQIVRDRM